MKEKLKKYWSTMDVFTRGAFCFLGSLITVITGGAICGNFAAQIVVVIVFTIIVFIAFCTAIFLVKEWFQNNF